MRQQQQQQHQKEMMKRTFAGTRSKFISPKQHNTWPNRRGRIRGKLTDTTSTNDEGVGEQEQQGTGALISYCELYCRPNIYPLIFQFDRNCPWKPRSPQQRAPWHGRRMRRSHSCDPSVPFCTIREAPRAAQKRKGRRSNHKKNEDVCSRTTVPPHPHEELLQ